MTAAVVGPTRTPSEARRRHRRPPQQLVQPHFHKNKNFFFARALDLNLQTFKCPLSDEVTSRRDQTYLFSRRSYLAFAASIHHAMAVLRARGINKGGAARCDRSTAAPAGGVRGRKIFSVFFFLSRIFLQISGCFFCVTGRPPWRGNHGGIL